jgi:predicted nucleic acid-binding protein
VSRPFVADSSVGLAWIHPAQATALTRALLHDVESGAVVHVAVLWPLEIANALLVAVRRKLITDAQRKAALALLPALNVVIDFEAPLLAWTTISDLASAHNLSAYDACYLELASRKMLPLASRDEPLRAAARKAGIEVL